MKNTFVGVPQTLFQSILIFTAAVILAALGTVTPFARGNGQQEKERSVQIEIYKTEPVEIVDVKVKGAPVKIGQKFAGDSDWFNGMVVTIKNISNKPVTFATVFVMAPYVKNGVRKQVNGRDLYANIELIYGEPPPEPGKRRSKPIALLMPGETADVLLDEGRRDQFYFRLGLEDSSTDIPELTLSTDQVAFLGDDNTMWMHSLWRRRDPKDPGSWLTIDDPPQMNHAAGIPKFLRDPTPGANLGGGGPNHMLDPLPRCTHRDIGDVPTNCDAYDIGGGLHCKWKNETILTSGVKNVVLGSSTVKYCEGSDGEHACAAIETHSDTRGNYDCTSPIAGLCGGEPDFGSYPSTGCATGFVYNGDTCTRSLAFQSRCADPTGFDPDSCSCPDGTTMSPIIIDVDHSGFSMTDAAGGVVFNILNDGVPLQISWTAASSSNAFLVLDRNGNGMIDNGKELFGNLTPQPPSQNENGFLALAEFDKLRNGGSNDGVIDKKDAVFNSLRLWQDNNHNGVSEASELHTLKALGLKSIELDYKESRRVDQYGNRFRYRARVMDTQDAQLGRWAWDVFLVVR